MILYSGYKKEKVFMCYRYILEYLWVKYVLSKICFKIVHTPHPTQKKKGRGTEDG